MNDIEKSYQAAVQCLPPHLRALASESRSTRDMQGRWALRDSDGVELVPVSQVSKAAPGTGNRPVSSAAFLRVCEEIGALFGQVERRLDALEAGGTKAAATRSLPTGYTTKDLRPRARWNGMAWAEVSE